MTTCKKRALTHGEDALKSVEALTITLANGDTVSFDLSAELAVPTDMPLLVRALARAPARLVFFAAQEERALTELRKAEAALARAEGESAIHHRAWLTMSRHDGGLGRDYVGAADVQAYVSCDETVQERRNAVDTAHEQYGILRALRRALDMRCSALRQLVAHQDQEFKQG